MNGCSPLCEAIRCIRMTISDLADDPDAVRPRSIEEALADLVTKYAWRPSAELARMIEQLQAEIVDRKATN
jgi:hypothetical protein